MWYITLYVTGILTHMFNV